MTSRASELIERLLSYFIFQPLLLTTLFPGSLLLPPPGASDVRDVRGVGKRDAGNEVASLIPRLHFHRLRAVSFFLKSVEQNARECTRA